MRFLASTILLSRALLLAAILWFHPGVAAAESLAISPRDLFADLPAVDFGMSFADAKKTIEKTGVSPIDGARTGGELVWDGQFAGTAGRATTLYKPDKGLWEVAVVVYAMDKQKAIFEQWTKTVTARHGPATETVDDEDAISRVWRFQSGIVLEIRMPKDTSSPIVDIHWVKK